MTGTRGGFNTGIVARGRIYVANDNRVYAFQVPGQTVTSIQLQGLNVQPDGSFQGSFTNVAGALFNLFSTTNLTVPFTNWTWRGTVPEWSAGQYQFTDSPAAASSAHFYRVTSP